MVSNVVTKLSLSPPHPSIPTKKDERLWILSDLFKKEVRLPPPKVHFLFICKWKRIPFCNKCLFLIQRDLCFNCDCYFITQFLLCAVFCISNWVICLLFCLPECLKTLLIAHGFFVEFFRLGFCCVEGEVECLEF